MGTDPSAKLFYGITYRSDVDNEDESDAPEIDYHHLAYEDQKRRMAGLFPEPPDTGDYRTPEWDSWRKQKEDWEQATTRVSASIFGYSDSLHNYICIAQSEFSVEWDETKDIPLLDVGPGWHAELKAFCERNSLPWREPGWKLVSLYF